MFYCNMTGQISLFTGCLFSKLFIKMYFLFYAEAFDDILKFEYLKFQTLLFLRMEVK